MDVILNKYMNCNKLLIGFGEKVEFDDELEELLLKLVKDKDYYIVSLANTIIDSSKFNVAQPVCKENDENWEDYLIWLQGTLNKDLLILEFGVGFQYPSVIRFPFEKTAFYNNKALLVRVNETFPQLPEEISEKGISKKCNFKDFLKKLWND